MNRMKINGEDPVFGLDIGTRNVVGTIGYKHGDRFVVVAQEIREHQTRAMLDGQIHDINRVAATIADIRDTLVDKTGIPLEEVCIAAAGRVLKTMNIHVDMNLERERNITKDDMNTVVSMGIEQAFSQFQEENDTDMRFYCVGHSVVRYYLNGMWMNQPEHHKAKTIGADMIATFLPDDVVDGLYQAVELAGMRVGNLTLEPIAAIRVAIPERFRLLNIAMIDVGAGTSDISITNDGSVIAFGMIPHAGDSITEVLARTCLIDFATAEKLKTAASSQKQIMYEDIMGIEQTISAEEVIAICQSEIDSMAKLTAERIIELNGGNSPSAVFIVGGGGKIKGFTAKIANELGIDPKRVALRGEEIMKDVDFPDGCRKDSTIITPIGICLSSYEHSNNFIYVVFNSNRIKLYDNNKLAVIDAAIQSSFAREDLFPKRGKDLNYTVNGKNRVSKGGYGESAHVYVNGEEVNINNSIQSNDVIVIEPSTAGTDAKITVSELVDCNGGITVKVGGEEKRFAKPVKVNGEDVSGDYQIKEGDDISVYSYFTYGQMAKILGAGEDDILFVNGERASKATGIYSDDSVEIRSLQDIENEMAMKKEAFRDAVKEHNTRLDNKVSAENNSAFNAGFSAGNNASDNNSTDNKVEENNAGTDNNTGSDSDTSKASKVSEDNNTDSSDSDSSNASKTPADSEKGVENNETGAADSSNVFKAMMEDASNEEKSDDNTAKKLIVIVNQNPIVMEGKATYSFVDIFDYIDFDTRKVQGSAIVTLINGENAQYTQQLKNGDKVDIYWE